MENRKIDRSFVDYVIDLKSESGSKQNIFIKCDNDLSLNLKYQNKIVSYDALLQSIDQVEREVRRSIARHLVTETCRHLFYLKKYFLHVYDIRAYKLFFLYTS